MASNLRVDQITASTAGSVSIGTATFTGGLSGSITGLNVTGVITATTLNQNVSGILTAQNGIKVTSGDILLTGGDGRKISFAADGSAHYIKMDNTFNGPVINGYGGIKFETNGTNERLRIDSSGNVGIGSTNPGVKLDVQAPGSSSRQNLARFRHEGQTDLVIQGQWGAQDIGSANGTLLYNSSQTLALRSGSSGNAHFVLRSGGNVGIGTDNPDTNLTVLGNTDGVLNLDTTDARGAFVRFKENGTSKAWVGCSEGIGSGGDQDDLGLRAVDNIRFRAGSSYVTINNSGNIVMGSGQGIDFSATADGSGTTTSELLDDYEEGTWTPELQATSTNPTYTYVSGQNYSSYVKIGGTVHAAVDFYINITAVGSGSLRVTLPFASYGSAVRGFCNSHGQRNCTAFTTDSTNITGWVAVGTNFFYIYINSGANGSESSVTQAQLRTGTNHRICIGAIYRTT